MDIRPVSNTAQSPPSLGDANPAATASPVQARTVAAPVQPVAAVQQPSPAPSMAEITQAIKSANRAMANFSHGLEFSVDEDSQKPVIKVVDARTKELIRQIPSVEILDIAKALELSQGLLVRQKA